MITNILPPLPGGDAKEVTGIWVGGTCPGLRLGGSVGCGPSFMIIRVNSPPSKSEYPFGSGHAGLGDNSYPNLGFNFGFANRRYVDPPPLSIHALKIVYDAIAAKIMGEPKKAITDRHARVLAHTKK